jgi:hypothetical protein
MPIGVKVLLDPPWMLIIIDLLENGENIIELVNGILGSFRPWFISCAHMSKLEHYLIAVDVAVGKILPKVDDEELGTRVPMMGSSKSCQSVPASHSVGMILP